MDGCGDHWMDGRMVRRTGKWGGKAGVCVSGSDGWMDGETIGWTGGWSDGRVNGAGKRGCV